MIDLSNLAKDLPPIFGRGDILRLFGGVLSPGFLANLDSQGDGPPRFYLGKRVAYRRDEFLDWLGKRAEGIPSSKPKQRKTRPEQGR